jgi:hypothetical protein
VSQLPSQGPVALFRTTTTVIEVSGADRLNYLNDVTTQNVKDSTIGTRTDALVLDGNGVVQAAFGIAVLAEHVLLLSPHDDVTTYILDVLAQRTFLLDARFTRTEQHVWELRGDTYEDAARSANLFAPAGTVRPSGTAVVVCGVAHGVEIVGHADAIETATHALTANGIPFGTEEDRQERRVCRGEPGYGTEIVRPHLPEEAGVLPSHVHLAKGATDLVGQCGALVLLEVGYHHLGALSGEKTSSGSPDSRGSTSNYCACTVDVHSRDDRGCTHRGCNRRRSGSQSCRNPGAGGARHHGATSKHLYPFDVGAP